MPQPTTSERILSAAQRVFTDYGYRRTSVDEIAREAGLSRTAIYNHFGNKRAVFRELVAKLHADSFRRARAAADEDADTGKRLFRVIDAKLGFFFELVTSSRHGEELLSEHSRHAGELPARSRKRIVHLLAEVLQSAHDRGELDLEPLGSVRTVAELFYLSAYGLQGEGEWQPSPEVWRRRLKRLIMTLLNGLRPPLDRSTANQRQRGESHE